MDQRKRDTAPLYEMLEQYREKGNTSYHVPGHKNGQAYSGGAGAGFLSEVMKADVTEITGTDDLHHPEGVIREAQLLAAECFGADESFFLVGGSTAGNLALILTVCPEPGMTLILQRNVHKSVIHGLMLAGVTAVFLEPELDPIRGLAIAPSAETVQAALAAHPEAAAVLVTMPNYYGMGSDLAPLAEACHRSGVPLLVDEAHGAHYGLHPGLPAGALSCGADGVVQSTHKMLPALTMGAMLHIQGPRLDRALLRQRLAMVQSSSPSYPVMASLDLARRLVHSQGAGAFTAGLAAVELLKRGLASQPRYRLLQPEPLQQQAGGASAAAGRSTPPLREAAYTAQDPFKVVIYDGTGVLSGFELQQKLEAKGCVPEMSDDRHVVLAFSLGSRDEDAFRLLEALKDIDAEERESILCAVAAEQYTSESEEKVLADSESEAELLSMWSHQGEDLFSAPVSFSMKPVAEEDKESIKLGESEGRVAAEMVIPYPPGIPLLYPGERITAAIKKRLTALAQSEIKFQGTADPALQYIKVYPMKKGGEA
ncbi:aminotransferase class I/II-fold pyridoxal phosphate-dependent enzyme [Paenibacillus sp. sgz500958]|uniref:aminotransferase class I/II-fold pyridoxal phosphate-dependent enzyme n=1 Tax=Paenibacillus sp. sgz500958 TaxID=3242475 RepID=UPI0036D39016